MPRGKCHVFRLLFIDLYLVFIEKANYLKKECGLSIQLR